MRLFRYLRTISFSRLILASFVVAVALPFQNVAYALNTFYSGNNIEFYDPNATQCASGSGSPDLSSVGPGSGAPNGLTYPNLDASKMASAIEQYIQKHAPSSPLKGTSSYAVVSAKAANVNPFLAYAHAFMESSLATTTVAGAQVKLKQGHNSFGRSATSSQPNVSEGGRLWYKWSSFAASVNVNAPENKQAGNDDWYAYDRAVFSTEINQGIVAYANKYAPPSENDTANYIKVMQGALNEMAGYAGATGLDTSIPTDGGSSNASCCATPSDGGTVVSDQGNNVSTAMGFLMSKGFNLQQAAALVGNMQQESGPTLNPKAGSLSGVYGIVQWGGGRITNLKSFASATSGNISSLDTQLRYAAWELGVNNEWQGHTAPYSSVGAAIKAAGTDVAKATQVVFDTYESPGDSTEPKRLNNAKALVQKYQDSPPINTGTGAVSGSTSSCSAAGSTALQATLLKYAWPTWKGANYKPQTSDYSAAVAAATSQGRFAGQGSSPAGDDCGGFVSILMYDSGFDKTYNHNDSYKDGAGATPIQNLWLQHNWQSLGTAASINASTLQQGDVAIINAQGHHHTWVYVGDVPGFSTKFASASQSQRSPMADPYGISGGFSDTQDVHWYRKKG